MALTLISCSYKMTVEDTYARLCRTPSDINEHLPTLKFLASLCTTVVECGVREVVSSYAFACGLPAHGTLILVDPYRSPNVDHFLDIEPRASFVHASDLTCPLVETDLLFIDTWHVYGQLKRELARWSSSVRMFIVMHDTEVDRTHGETIRMGDNARQQSADSGIPIEEIMRGLEPAIHEFLRDNPDWVVATEYFNNNGLTILRRVRSLETKQTTPRP